MRRLHSVCKKTHSVLRKRQGQGARSPKKRNVLRVHEHFLDERNAEIGVFLETLHNLWHFLLVFIFIQAACVGITYGQNIESSLLISSNLGEGQTRVSLENVLDNIEQRYRVTFLYEEPVIAGKYLDSMQLLLGQAVGQKLAEVLTDLNLDYLQLDEETYVLVEKKRSPATRSQQPESITGTVTDAGSDETLPGVNVIVKGTTTGTSTDTEGNYELAVSSLQDTLVFSFVGYQQQEIPINGRTEIDVSLQAQAVVGEEMVVTAMGRNREARELSYATQQVDENMISATANADISRSLQGKVAGMTVRQISGKPGGEGSKITIRGSNSLTGSNAPLFVVDGFPVGNSIDFNINSSDIKSVNVLKGAKAATLYGLRASNGVVIISTKRGVNNRLNSPTINVSSDYTFDRLSIYPDHQKTYAQGSEGVFRPYSAFSWGPRIDEMGTYTNQLGEEEEARAYDNVKDFFQTGGTSNNSIGISNRFDQGNYSLGLNYTRQTGIIPKSGLDLITTNLSIDYNLSSKIKLSSTINYSDFNSYAPGDVSQDNSLRFASFNAPPSYNLKDKPIHEPGEPYDQVNYRGQHNNVYWTVENNKLIRKNSTFSGNMGIDYDIRNWIQLNYRFGYKGDFGSGYYNNSIGSAPNGLTDPPSGGRLEEDFSRNYRVNSNLNLTMVKQFGDDLDLEFLLGHEFIEQAGRNLATTGIDLNVPNFYSFTNAATITSNQSVNERRSYGFFSNLNIGWKDILYLDAAIRNDVVSNMPRDNRSFIYPSVGAGFIFSDFLGGQDLLSFGKLRINYGEVGQAGPIYATKQVFNEGSGLTFPYEGINAFSMSSSLNSSDLEPENIKTMEYGINLNFFEDRVKLDYTYFHSKISGQILRVPVPNSTGFASELRNAGKMENKGHEITFNYEVIRNQTLSWQLASNFTSYTNKVLELAEGIEELALGGTGSTSIIVAVPGREYPVLKGNGFVRDPATSKMVVDSRETLPNGNENPNYGMPLVTPRPIYFGKADPDFELNFLNTIRYKNLTFYFQIDWRKGGNLGSNQTRMSYLYGTHPKTSNRNEDVIMDAAKGYFDENGDLIIEDRTNDITIQKGFQYFRRRGDQIQESKVFDASFIRLRELRLDYQFPQSVLNRLPFREGSSFYVKGRNLWLIKSGLPYYDPEMSTGGRDIGWDSLTYPQVMNIGLGINIEF